MNGIHAKTGLAIGLLLLALLGGLYFSGFLALALLKLSAPLQPTTYWDYFRALDLPQVRPYAGEIKAAGAFGFGLPLLGYGVALFLILKPRAKSLHGDARFATRADLARSGLLKKSPNGIVIGKAGGELLQLGGQQFVALAAPTRSGKGVSVVIPNLLNFQESAVVLDIKQECFDLTSGWRASQGQSVFLFNPLAEDLRTHRWNPMSYVSRDPSFRVTDLQAIAAILYPDDESRDAFWINQARNAFVAFASYAFDNLEDALARGWPEVDRLFPTLGGIYRLSSGDGKDLRRFLQGLAGRSFLGHHARTAFSNLLSQADETFASIMGSFQEPLHIFLNPVLDAATSGNDFLLTDVRKKKMTVYIGIQPNKLAEAKKILNLFFSQLIGQNTHELPQNNPVLKHQCLLLLDEFTSIGRVDILASAISYIAGYNLRVVPIFQSMAQLDATYGKEVARTIMTNHAVQIIFAPREQRDASDYSEMLGYTTMRKRNRTRSRGHGGSVSYSETEERRALMLPQELKALGSDTEIILYEGIAYPVMCQKIKYYQDRYFTSRLLPKVDVPTLKV